MMLQRMFGHASSHALHHCGVASWSFSHIRSKRPCGVTHSWHRRCRFTATPPVLYASQIYPMDMMRKCPLPQGSTRKLLHLYWKHSRNWLERLKAGVTQWPTLKPDGWNPQAPIIHLSSCTCGEWMRMAGMQVFQHEGMSLVCFVEVVIAFNHLQPDNQKPFGLLVPTLRSLDVSGNGPTFGIGLTCKGVQQWLPKNMPLA